ncbi:hypothetical protein [Streptomyces sp. NBC_00212]
MTDGEGQGGEQLLLLRRRRSPAQFAVHYLDVTEHSDIQDNSP